ncbi:aldo/keto reductase [Vibrio brasiliensis]|uniref:aldo/keto reductase n=1 Tax=Vibrio brasiliensis TaxID=170652 RepID=UPI001EFC6012|nr:aldo/keto reductase [Vibrio brasiliensis]MCG9749229.1 aldo/keto reductase [Vibrio brasiliensis]MCG9782369.1 aldo/keto reductase [Vibrio brasiliensis]
MNKSHPVFSPMIQGYWRMAEWGMNTQQQYVFVQQHLELGITTVDHAPVYGPDSACEKMFGQVLALDSSLRDKIEIVSKCGIYRGEGKQVNHYNSSKAAIIESVEQSLMRLNTDHLDVLLLHRPDLLMDADEAAQAFEQLKAAGKVKHFGVSNFTPAQFDLLQSRLEAPLITNQVEINPVNLQVTEDGTLDQLQKHRVQPMAWSCLAGGTIFSDSSEQAIRLRETLVQVGEEIGADCIDQVIFAWVMRLPAKPVPIIGSGNIQRVQTAVGALQLELSNEQWYRIWVASKGHGVA